MSKNNSTKIWGIGIGAVVIAIIAIYAITSDGSSITLTDNSIAEGDWVKGNPEADVVIIEYSDFQCPACKAMAPRLDAITDEFQDNIAFAYRHFPLLSNHPNAEEAARAAEAAGLQDAFWEMHDELFLRQSIWSRDSDPEDIFVQYATDLGLDAEQFRSDYNSGAVKDAVRSDLKSAESLGLFSTPTVFVDGEKINNSMSDDALRTLIRNEISEAQTEARTSADSAEDAAEETEQ